LPPLERKTQYHHNNEERCQKGTPGVRGSFLRVPPNFCDGKSHKIAVHKLSFSLKKPMATSKTINFVHEILSHQRSRRWFEDPGKKKKQSNN
jgi:hypothetical protein